MQVVRVYTGDDGRSHFEDVEIPLADTRPIGRTSELIGGSGVMFREVGGDYDLDFHNAPRRQFVVNLTGSVDIGVGDGTVRRLGPGDILLAEDTEGEGHTSRAVDGKPRKCLFIPIDSVFQGFRPIPAGGKVVTNELVDELRTNLESE